LIQTFEVNFSAPRSNVDIKITDRQNVDIKITNHQNANIKITYHQNVDIQIIDSQNLTPLRLGQVGVGQLVMSTYI
jgi:hypothetical protein